MVSSSYPEGEKQKMGEGKKEKKRGKKWGDHKSPPGAEGFGSLTCSQWRALEMLGEMGFELDVVCLLSFQDMFF